VSAALELDRLGKRYSRRWVVEEVSLSLGAGSFLALVGPSGSGKSTLLRLVAGVERPDAGRVVLSGRTVADPTRQLPPERRRLAMVFQDGALWPHLNALENVRFGLRRLKLGRVLERERAHQFLERVGLGWAADRYPHQLSGGEQQRVGIARALAGEPQLLLFDEPLSALDAGLRDQLRLEIAGLVREQRITTLYITHDLREALALGDLVGVLNEGRLLQLAAPEQLYANPASRFVAAFTGVAGELEGRVLANQPARANRYLVRVALACQRPRQLCGHSRRPLEPGSAVVVAVRASGVALVERGSRADTLEAVVIDCAYVGGGYRYALELGGGGRLTGVPGAVRLERGHRVAVALDPRWSFVFPAAAGVPPLGEATQAQGPVFKAGQPAPLQGVTG